MPGRRHVEHSVVTAAHALQKVGDLPAENAVGLLHGKAVMSSRDRSVSGKYAAASDRLRIPLINHPMEVATQLKLHQTYG